MPDLSAPPPLRVRSHTRWTIGARRSSSQLSSLRFRFLNKERELRSAADWNNSDWGRLWLYNLHYFDDLNAAGSETRTAWHRFMVGAWIAENPPGVGIGWESYPLSLRIVNWIKWAMTGEELSPKTLESLAVQIRYLEGRLEFHLLGNHLFANAKALVFGGMFFEGREADRWLHAGLDILLREVSEQILADGGHFERSPMYHSIVLEDLLDLLNLFRAYPKALPEKWQHLQQDWQQRAEAMLHWMRKMTHPDRGIALFNDSALEIASCPAELEGYAERLGMTSEAERHDIVHLTESGYVRVQKGPAVAILDVGKIGPDYLLGHAHADTLSFELSIDGRRVVVDSGTSTYESTGERLRQRSTSAHNTVEIDQLSSSEVWASFRVARRAYPCGLKLADNVDRIVVRCGHDGYRRLRGGPVHWREWVMSGSAMRIVDWIDGRFGRAVARIHFHPECEVGQREPGFGTVNLDGRTVLTWSLVQGHARVIETTYHPQFGVSLSNKSLEIELVASRADILLEWIR